MTDKTLGSLSCFDLFENAYVPGQEYTTVIQYISPVGHVLGAKCCVVFVNILDRIKTYN